MSHLETALSFFEKDYPDALEIFAEEARIKDTHWFYSLGDELSNRNKEDIILDRLSSHPSKEPHGNVLYAEWNRIVEIIKERHSSHH